MTKFHVSANIGTLVKYRDDVIASQISLIRSPGALWGHNSEISTKLYKGAGIDNICMLVNLFESWCFPKHHVLFSVKVKYVLCALYFGLGKFLAKDIVDLIKLALAFEITQLGV